MRKKYFDVPHAIGVLGRTFVEPITPGLSQRGRLLGAVAQWQLRLCFFSRDIPSAFVLIEGYFLRAYFSATIQTFQKETQLDALSNRVKTFRKFSTGAILLASKARNFRKFLGFLSILLFFFSQTTANWPDVGTNRRKTMFSLIW